MNKPSFSKVKIGIVFSSLDRYELTHMALENMLIGIDPDKHDVTVLWQDGSTECDAKRFFGSFDTDLANVIKKGGMCGLGAARVIERGMNELKKIDNFDWIGTIESDGYLAKDWLSECLYAVEESRKSGFNPGIVTPYVLHMCVVEYHTAFVTMSCCAASGSFFKPEAWALVPSVEIGHQFDSNLLDKCGFPVVHKKSTPLGLDWTFAPSVYHGGFDIIGTRISKLLNCGCSDETKNCHKGYSYVMEGDPPLWAGEGSVRLGLRDYDGWYNVLKNASKKSSCHRLEPDFMENVKRRLRGLKMFLIGE